MLLYLLVISLFKLEGNCQVHGELNTVMHRNYMHVLYFSEEVNFLLVNDSMIRQETRLIQRHFSKYATVWSGNKLASIIFDIQPSMQRSYALTSGKGSSQPQKAKVPDFRQIKVDLSTDVQEIIFKSSNSEDLLRTLAKFSFPVVQLLSIRPETKQFRKNFVNHLATIIKQELFSNTSEVQNLLLFLQNDLLNVTSVRNPALKSLAKIEHSKSFQNIYMGLLYHFEKSPPQVALIRYIFDPSAIKVHKELFRVLSDSLRDNAIAHNAVYGFLERIRILQSNLIIKDMTTYFNQLLEKDSAAGSTVTQALTNNFKRDSWKFFSYYKIQISLEFFTSMMNILKVSEYPKFYIHLLNCNIALDSGDKNTYKFITLLLKITWADRTDILSGSEWNKSLASLSFIAADNVTVNNYFQENSQELLHCYFDSKLQNLYSTSFLCSVIFKKCKQNALLADNLTGEIISSISSNNTGKQKFLHELYERSNKDNEYLQHLIGLLIARFEAINKLGSFHYYRAKSNLLKHIFSVVIHYSMSYINYESTVSILAKIVDLNHHLNKVAEQQLHVPRYFKGKEDIELGYNNLIILLVTSLRKKGLTDNSLALLNILIDLNIENSNFSNPEFTNRSLVAKDIFTEVYQIIKMTFSNDPRVILSYFIELLINTNDILSTTDSKNLTNEDILQFYEQHSSIDELSNIDSSLLIANKLGLIRLIYESNPASINFKNSHEMEYYSANLLRATVKPELKNTKITSEHLSIVYASVFDFLATKDDYSTKKLKALFDNYIATVLEYQLVLKYDARHVFLSKYINDVVLSQFVQQSLKLKNPQMACDFLMKFLDSIKIDSRKLTPHSFEKICYCYSLKMLEESDSRYFDQMIQLLNLMQRRTGYPITFWNKVSLILALSNSDSDAAHKLYLELTDDGKNFHRLHHSLLYKIAIENEWPLPSFLQSVEEVPAESLHSMPQQEDLQEFDNDKTDMFEEEILLEADKEKFGIIQRKELDSETFSRLLQYLPHVDKPFNQLIQGQQLPAEVST